MRRMKIVVLDGYAANPGDLSWDGIAQFGELTVYDRTPPEQIVERIADNDILILNKPIITREIIEACPSVRMIALLATGYNIVDIAAAREHDIPVCNIPAYSTASVAQTAMAHLLEITMHVGLYTGLCKDGTWTRSRDFSFSTAPLTELAGKTVGIVGYGQIGQAFGKICRAMGMKLLVYAKHRRPELEDEDCRYVSLDELYANSDVVSLHCPVFPETIKMINAETIAKMKDGAIFLNTSRGQLVDEQALADALNSGKLRAAGVDVVSVEPIQPDNPLLTAKNVYMTPHVGWAPHESRARLMEILAQNVRSFIEGHPINVVN